MTSNQLVKARKKIKKTQRELAEILDISTQSVSNWENGHSIPVTVSYAMRWLVHAHENGAQATSLNTTR